MTDDLVTRLRDAVNGEHDMTPHGADCLQAAARIEADAATIARLEGENLSRIDAMTLMCGKLAEWQASQHYTYIDKRGQPVLARDLEDRAEAAEAKVAQLENERILSRAAYDGVSSLLLSVQQDSITAEKKVAALEAALGQIASDPYKYGMRVQRMKSIARAALRAIGERAE